MAQVTSGTIKSGSNNNTYFYLNWERTSYSIANNTSTISWQVGIGSTKTAYWYSNAIKVKSVYINGVKVSDGGTWSNKTITPNNPVQLLSGTATISHNTNGTKTFNANLSAWLYSSFDTTANGDFELVSIPRHATSVQSLASKEETTIKMNWSSDSIIDYIWYSKDNGSTWTGVDVTDGKSGSYTINGLSANTTYNIKTRVRRKDSQLTTDSSALSVTTYDFPKPTQIKDFTIGNGTYVKVYNPLGRWFELELVSNENGQSIGYNYNNGEGDFIAGEGSTSITNQYKSIPNSKSGTYYAKVTYGSSIKTLGNKTYSIKGNETPTTGSLSYKDNNSTTTAITGNNQRIIRNNSKVLFTIGSASAKNSASISKYEITLNGVTKSRTSAGDIDFGTLNASSNINATLKVTDSRGLSATKEIALTIDDWILPSAIISLSRKNNFYAESYLKVDGTCSSLNGKNALTIQEQHKKVSDSSYTELQDLSDNVQKILDLNNNYEWNIKVIVKDKLGTTTYNLTLERGMPIAFFDRKKLSLGINCFPNGRETFELNGYKIVESGSNENGYWVKYEDGTMICRNSIQAFEKKVTESWGSLYFYNDSTTEFYFAKTFIDTPIVSITGGNIIGSIGYWLGDYGGRKVTSSYWKGYTLLRPTQGTVNVHLNVIAIGRWK